MTNQQQMNLPLENPEPLEGMKEDELRMIGNGLETALIAYASVQWEKEDDNEKQAE